MRAGQESFLSRAVFADGRLWVLSDAGQVSSITQGKNVRVEERLKPFEDKVKLHETNVDSIKKELSNTR